MCKVNNCTNSVHCKEYCKKHYTQFRKYGKIFTRTVRDKNVIVKHETYAEIILENRQCVEVARTMIDLEDIDKIKNIKWRFSKYVKGNGTSLHRFLLSPGDHYVDHINHNELDNRRCNLRLVTPQQNMFNKKSKGVYYHKTRKYWRAYLYLNKKQHKFKEFKTENEAIEARLKWEKDYFKEYAFRRNKNDKI